MSVKEILTHGEEPMKKTLERMKADLASIRTGRASTALLDSVKVDSYGSMLPINQLASLSIPDAKTIEIRPWDMSQLQSIEKAILKSDIGLTPANDGKIIRLTMPKLTEERRKDIMKGIHKNSEDFKVAIRNERRQIVEHIKKAEKDKTITEDERKKGEAESQKLTDLYMKKIDDLLAVKEKEVMEV
jgi:ribosome recycling factor